MNRQFAYSYFEPKFKNYFSSLYSTNDSFLYYFYIILLDLLVDKILTYNPANELGFFLDFYFNFFLMAYCYSYFKERKSTFHFLLLFFLLKYLHYLSNIIWSLSQISSFFDKYSVLNNIGLILKIDLRPLSFFLFFLAGFIDFIFLIILFKFIQLLLSLIDLKLVFNDNITELLRKNALIIKQSFHNTKLIKKIKVLLIFSFIIATPLAYSETLQTINDTNEGIFYLTKAIDLLNNYFSNNIDVSNVILNPNNLLSIKNNLYFSAKYFELAASHLKSINSPLYAIIEFLLGINGITDKTPTIINNIGKFLGNTMLNLVASIEDYFTFMDQLTNEILRRAYWWELEANNITYNPKRDFYSKFNSEIPQNLDTSVITFRTNFLTLQNEFIQAHLNKNTFIVKFNTQINRFSLIVDQITYLAKIAPPLLNATFTSVEVTNALAFNQFVTAKNLVSLSQRYLQQSQNLLTNYTFDPTLSTPIADIGTIMSELNYINHEFVNMTIDAQNMFLALSKTIILLNDTTYQNKLFDTNQFTINNNIIQTNNEVSQIVQTNIQKITGFVNDAGNILRFPFKAIMSHFLWFYQGYAGAVSGYRNLWLTSSGTMKLLSDVLQQQNLTEQFIGNYTNNAETPLNDSHYSDLLIQYYVLHDEVLYVGQLLNQSVTNGAIIVNLPKLENLIGYNKTTNDFIDSGINKYINNFLNFYNLNLNDNFTLYNDSYNKVTSTNLSLLQSLSGAGIFLNMSEQVNATLTKQFLL